MGNLGIQKENSRRTLALLGLFITLFTLSEALLLNFLKRNMKHTVSLHLSETSEFNALLLFESLPGPMNRVFAIVIPSVVLLVILAVLYFRAIATTLNLSRMLSAPPAADLKKRLPHKSERSQQALKRDLEGAANRKEFYLVYQPQVELESGRICGFETLIRWQHQSGEIVSPARFIPLAEESGLIIPIGEWIIDEACRFSNDLTARGINNIRTGINISVRHMNEPGFFEKLISIVEKNSTSPHTLDLEITESVKPGEIGEISALTEKLRKAGFTISIDDYGTGYSSLSYLQTLSFDRIKIDKSFVDRMLDNSCSRHIINSIISLSRSLEKEIIAEGVETAEQMECLLSEQCSQVQGYHISPPLSRSRALSLI